MPASSYNSYLGPWSSQGARGHSAVVLCWSHRASPAPWGPVVPPRSIGGATCITARCRALANWGHMLLFHAVETTPARLPAQPQAGGRGAHHPRASWGAPISPLPSMGGPSSRDPRDGTAAPDAVQAERAKSRFPAQPFARARPGTGTRRQHRTRERCQGWGSLMDIHEWRVR